MIVVGIRLDIIAVFYIIWLGLFMKLSRHSIQRLWPFYLIFLIIIFPIQYLIVVGAPPFLCFGNIFYPSRKQKTKIKNNLEYPWTNSDMIGWSQLKRWLFMPDYLNPPSATQLIGKFCLLLIEINIFNLADFFQLLFICQQWRVFRYEINEKYRQYVEIGGSNREIIHIDNIHQENPTWNFVINRRHWFDHIKYVIFMHSTWIVLSVIYLYGIKQINLVHLGYTLVCFYFFWRGQTFFEENISKILRL